MAESAPMTHYVGAKKPAKKKPVPKAKAKAKAKPQAKAKPKARTGYVGGYGY